MEKILTIEEIKDRIKKGRRKWGYSLAVLLKEEFENKNLPLENLVSKIKENYDIEISYLSLQQLKFRYHLNVSNDINKEEKKDKINTEEIVQKKEIDILDFRSKSPESSITIVRGSDI